MTYISDWAAGLCSTAVGLSLVTLLVPAGRIRRTVTVLAGVCYFCCLISPLAAWCQAGMDWFSMDMSRTEVSDGMTRLTDEQIDRALEEALCRDAEDRLKDYGVSVTNARIVRDTSEQDGIYIRQVILTVQGEKLPRKVYTELELAWGVEVEVINGNG